MEDRYKQQRRMARQRGIDWHFTYDEWVAWWEHHAGPDWYAKRGRKAGQLCMSRRGDTGPYASWNVECVTTGHNHVVREKKLTPETARAIYLSQESQKALIRRYGVNRTMIKRIKQRRNWLEVTKNLGPPGRSVGYNINGIQTPTKSIT